MEHFTGRLRLHFPSPCGAAEGPWSPTHAVPAPLPLVRGWLGLEGVSQDTQTCIGPHLTQRLAPSINSTSAAPGREDDEEATRTGWGQAPGG